MSKVVLLFFAPDIYDVVPCYYSQLIEGFKECGHDLLAVNTFKNKTDTINSSVCTTIEDRVINFQPDLIIAFNNVTTKKIYEKTNCPIFIPESDTYNYFPNKELIKEYSHRIYIGIFSKYRFNIWYDLLPFIPKERIIYFKNSTSLKSNPAQKQDINISIIATVLGLSPRNGVVRNLVSNYGNVEGTKEALKVIQKAHRDISSVTEEDCKFLQTSYTDLSHYINYLKRPYLLNQLADLGLVVSGKFYDLEHIFSGLPDFALCLSAKEIMTKQANEDFYNRSKISINAHFAHNIDNDEISGYSWRVCDVMATNACLVSSSCKAIKDDFKQWVEIPMFSNRFEAYDICKKLLNDEKWRSDIVLGSHAAIREGGFKFSDRVKELEEIFSLKKDLDRDQIRRCELILPSLVESDIQQSSSHHHAQSTFASSGGGLQALQKTSKIYKALKYFILSFTPFSEQRRLFKDWAKNNQQYFLYPPIKPGSKLRVWYRAARRERKIFRRWKKYQ